MKWRIAIVMCAAVMGLMTLSSHAMAQQKTVKACQEEWKANKAANKANGITEKAYVAECRGGAAAAQPTAAPAAPPAAAAALLRQPLPAKRLQRHAARSGRPTRRRMKPMASQKRLTWPNAEVSLLPRKLPRHRRLPLLQRRRLLLLLHQRCCSAGEASSPGNLDRQTRSRSCATSGRGE